MLLSRAGFRQGSLVTMWGVLSKNKPDMTDGFSTYRKYSSMKQGRF